MSISFTATAVKTAPALFGGAPKSAALPLFGMASKTEQSEQPLFSSQDVAVISGSAPVASATTAGFSLSALSAAQTAALAALPGSSAVALRHVLKVVSDSPSAQHQLGDLLEKGALGQSEGNKTTVLHLQALTTEQRGPGLDGAQLTRELIAALHQPDNETVYQGADRYTCAATNLERQLAEQPARLAAIVEALSNPRGSAYLGSFPDLRRVEGSQEDDGSGRNALNRLVQGALMGAAASEHGGYDARTDRFKDGSAPGLKKGDIARLTAWTEQENQAAVEHNSKTHMEFERIVRAAQPGDTFQLGVSWKDQDHMLLLQSHDGELARYFDPQTGHNDSMPLSRLLFKTQMAIFSESQLQGASFPAEAVTWGIPKESKGAL